VSSARDAALFITLATLWGLSFPAISIGLDYLPPLLFAAFRYDVAAVVLLSNVTEVPRIDALQRQAVEHDRGASKLQATDESD
jgi:drug/metabolite transporter (DMT)-like permease